MVSTNIKTSYNKPFLTITQQIEQLINRGMIIDDIDKAMFHLENLNYYRLSAYWLFFEQSNKNHLFHPNTNFTRVIELYNFDRELRLFIFNVIEKIEISVRSKFAHEISKKYGSHAHLNPSLFNPTHIYNKTITNLKREIDRSKEPFIKHFKNNYKEELPPIWASVEVMTLGQISNWFSILKFRQDRQLIAKYYHLDETVFKSFLHHLTIIRNIVAHHGVLWNKKLTLEFKIPKSMKQNYNLNDRKKLFNTFVMLEYLLNKISKTTNFKKTLDNLLNKYKIDRKLLGYKIKNGGKNDEV